MNIKKIIVLLLFTIAIVGIMAPVDAALKSEAGLMFYDKENKKNELFLEVVSDFGLNTKNPDKQKYFSQRKVELNKVNKIIFSIDGKKTKTYKKPAKGWPSMEASFGVGRLITIKGNSINKKNYSIELYDKNNKLLQNKKGKLGEFNGEFYLK